MGEFFRFEKSKVIAFAILILITLFLGFNVMRMAGTHCESGFECPIDYGEVVVFILFILIVGWPFLLALGIEHLIFERVDWIHAKDVPFLIGAFILSILYMYFLSCLMVFIYRKFKK